MQIKTGNEFQLNELPITSKVTWWYTVGACRKSTLHVYVPASNLCTPVTFNTAGNVDTLKWARSPNASLSDHRSAGDGGFDGIVFGW